MTNFNRKFWGSCKIIFFVVDCMSTVISCCPLTYLIQLHFSTDCLKSMEDKDAFKYSPRGGAASLQSPSDLHLHHPRHLTDDVPDQSGGTELR